VGRDAADMGAGDNLHTAVLAIRFIDGDPGGVCFGRLEPPIGHVLMPGDKFLRFRATGVLAEKMRRQEHDVVADEAGDGADDTLVWGELPDEFVLEMPRHQSDCRGFFAEALLELSTSLKREENRRVFILFSAWIISTKVQKMPKMLCARPCVGIWR